VGALQTGSMGYGRFGSSGSLSGSSGRRQTTSTTTTSSCLNASFNFLIFSYCAARLIWLAASNSCCCSAMRMLYRTSLRYVSVQYLTVPLRNGTGTVLIITQIPHRKFAHVLVLGNDTYAGTLRYQSAAYIDKYLRKYANSWGLVRYGTIPYRAVRHRTPKAQILRMSYNHP
jgi:hypothetical protein